MLEIVQAGQAGKTSFLFDMHRFRKCVFKDRLGWNVNINPDGLEVDQFDLPETIYLLALDDDQRVIGHWRLLPTSGPTMIREVWPQFLDSIAMPGASDVWEASRFAVQSRNDASQGSVQRATQELFCGLTELSLLCGIREIYTMYDMRIARLLKRLDCAPRDVSEKLRIDGALAQVGAFVTDQAMLNRLRAATGIRQSLIKADMLPPALAELSTANPIHRREEHVHA